MDGSARVDATSNTAGQVTRDPYWTTVADRRAETAWWVSPAAFYLRPFLDLGDAGGPIHARVAFFAAQWLDERRADDLPVQINTPAAFRRALVAGQGLHIYDIDDPDELAIEHRSPLWHVLCDVLQDWEHLSSCDRLNAATVLNKLGLYRATLSYVTDVSPTAIATDSFAARLAMKRANALYKIYAGTARPTVEDVLARVARTAPRDSRTRLAAAINLVVHFAKSPIDIQSLARWAQVAELEAKALDPERRPGDALLCSQLYRAVSFVPFFAGETARVTAMMDEAEFWARRLAEEPGWEMLAAENLHPLIETRAREASWLGDSDLALERTLAFVDLDPLDGKVHFRLGEAYRSRAELQLAIDAYSRASTLAPHYASIAFLRAADCYEQLGALDAAADACLEAIRVDPLSVSGLLRLLPLAKRLGWRSVESWCADQVVAVRAVVASAGSRLRAYEAGRPTLEGASHASTV